MSAIKRAFNSITRKKAKSLALVFLLTLTVTAVGTMITLWRAVNNSDNSTSFLLPDAIISSQDTFSLKSAKAAAKAEGVEKACFFLNVLAYTTDCTSVESNDDGIILNQNVLNQYKNAVTLVGITDFSLSDIFLIEGEWGGACIHRRFAEKNGLGVGSEIRLNNSAKTTAKLRISGIFEGESENAVFPQDMKENTIYASFSTAQNLSESNAVSEAYYFFLKEAESDEVIKSIKSLPFDWDKCKLESAKDTENTVRQIEKLIKIITGCVILVCLFVLSMTTVFITQSRRHETGILISLGIGKPTIFLQYIFEMLFIAIPCFIFASYPCMAIANALSEKLITKAQFSLSAYDAIVVFAANNGIIIISVGIAFLPIIRMKPHKILSQMS